MAWFGFCLHKWKYIFVNFHVFISLFNLCSAQRWNRIKFYLLLKVINTITAFHLAVWHLLCCLTVRPLGGSRASQQAAIILIVLLHVTMGYIESLLMS